MDYLESLLPQPPIPTTMLLCPADLIACLGDTLGVLAARSRWPLAGAGGAPDNG